MKKAIFIEFYKIRRRKVGLTVLAVVIVQLMYGLWQMKYNNAHELSQGWRNCFYRFSTINCVFMPMLAAVIGSRLSDIEHKGNNLKLLKSIMPSKQLFAAKFLCGGFYMFITTLLQVGTMILIGKLRGITEEIPVGYFCYYALFTLIVNLTVILLQLILSLQFTNQVIAFGVSIAGMFLGLYSLFFENAAKYVLWGYYAILSPVIMDWDKSTRIVNFYWSGIPFKKFLVLLLGTIFLYNIGKKLFIRKEI